MKRFSLAALISTEPQTGTFEIDEPTRFNPEPEPFAGYIMSRQLRDRLLTMRGEKGELIFKPTIFGIPCRPGVTFDQAKKVENEIRADFNRRTGL